MRRLFVASIAFVAAAAPATAAGPNGGITTIADGHPVELVSTDSELTFFILEEDGTPAVTSGMAAKAFVMAAGRTETVALKGAAPNRLVGTLSSPLPASAKVVLSVRMHRHTLQVRFEK